MVTPTVMVPIMTTLRVVVRTIVVLIMVTPTVVTPTMVTPTMVTSHTDPYCSLTQI